MSNSIASAIKERKKLKVLLNSGRVKGETRGEK